MEFVAIQSIYIECDILVNNLILQINGVAVIPEEICCLGGDICVSDSKGKRIVTASGGKWGEVILPEVGKIISCQIETYIFDIV